MKIQESTVTNFIINTSRYHIPFYQRSYTWDKTNIDQLLEDIIEFKADNYFLGSIVIKTKHDQVIIVDGQQRISTMLIMLKVISKYVNDPYLTLLISKEFDSKNIIDGHILEDILKGKDILGDDIKSNYFLNYLHISNKISEENVNDIYEKIKKIIFAIIYVDEKTDEHRLFAQINSTGKRLDAYDLSKNLLFGEIRDINVQNDLLHKIDIVLKDVPQKDNEVIIRQFLAYKTGELVKKDSNTLYGRIRKLFIQDYNHDAITMIEELLEYFSYYLYIKKQDSFEQRFYKNLFILVSSFDTYSSLLIYIFKENSDFIDYRIEISKEQEIAIIDALKVLETYKVRREIVALKEKEITRFIPSIKEKLNEIEYSTIAEALVIILLQKANEKGHQYRMPTIEEFNRQFIVYPLYNTQKIAHQLLLKIEYINTKEKISNKNLTVEHMMPQNLTPEWEDSIDSMDTYSRYLHTIGNLTLTASNSELARNTFTTKKHLMYENSHLNITHLFSDYEIWTKDSIVSRANKLLEIFNSEYNIEDLYDECVPKQVFVEAFDYSATFNKNKSYFKKLDPINIKMVNNVIVNLVVYGMSTLDNEQEVFNVNCSGWISQAIYHYVGIEKPPALKKSMNNIQATNFIKEKEDTIKQLVCEVNEIIMEHKYK